MNAREMIAPAVRAAARRWRFARPPMPECKVVPPEAPESGAWGQEWFDRFYSLAPDPWALETNRYEQRKYGDLLRALPPSAGRVLEIGCSIGVFTERLAPRATSLLAVDISDVAVQRARERLAPLPNVQVERMDTPRELPEGPFDAIVVADVMYYWSAQVLTEAASRLAALLAPGGSLVALHWRLGNECVLTGDEVHDLLLAELPLRHARDARREQYRLDRWKREA